MPPLFTLTIPLILASKSPRRRALLDQIGLSFTVQKSPADESIDASLPPKKQARVLAHRKATPIADEYPSSLVLAADTIVIHNGEVLGKPNSSSNAKRMLRQLSESTHTVYTGLSVHHKDSCRVVTTGKSTEITFAALEESEIAAYVDSRSPMDKAGGYGIQDHAGPLFVDHLDGDYYNVVGLPLRLLYTTLQETFSDALQQTSTSHS